MSKIDLNSIQSSYSTGLINENFEKIETALNEQVLYKDNPDSFSANSMTEDLDMDGHRIINTPEPVDDTDLVRLVDLQGLTSGGGSVPDDIEERLDQAETDIDEIQFELSGLATDANVVFRGSWDVQTGSFDQGYAVYHNNALWASITDIADVTASEPSKDNTDWLIAVEGALVYNNMQALLNGPTGLYEGQRVAVTGFHPGYTKGGGIFAWTTQVDKSAHDGVIVIDPSHSNTPASWSNSTMNQWYQSENTGAGVWYRTGDTSRKSIFWYGISGDGSSPDMDTKALTAAWDSTEQGVIDLEDIVLAALTADLPITTDADKSITWDAKRAIVDWEAMDLEQAESINLFFLPGAVEANANATKIFSMVDRGDNHLPNIRIYRKADYTGGLDGRVCPAISVQTSTAEDADNFEWTTLSRLDNYSNTSAENVALYAQGNKRGTGPTWALCTEARDHTEGTNPNHGLLGAEIGVFANGLDRSPLPTRIGVDVVGGKGVATGDRAEIGAGVRVSPTSNDTNQAYFRRGFEGKGEFTEAVFNTTDAILTSTGSALALADDQRIHYDTAKTVATYYDSTEDELVITGPSVRVAGGLTVDGAFALPGDFTPDNLDVTGDVTVGGTLNVTGSISYDTVSSTGNTDVGGDLTVTGISNLNDVNLLGNIRLDTDNVMTFNDDDNIGIGYLSQYGVMATSGSGFYVNGDLGTSGLANFEGETRHEAGIRLFDNQWLNLNNDTTVGIRYDTTNGYIDYKGTSNNFQGNVDVAGSRLSLNSNNHLYFDTANTIGIHYDTASSVLAFTGDNVYFDREVSIQGQTDISGGLDLTGLAKLNGGISTTSTLSVGSSATFSGSATFGSTLTSNNTANFNSTVNLGGTTNVNGQLRMNDNQYLYMNSSNNKGFVYDSSNNALAAMGATFYVDQATTLNSIVYCVGEVTAAGGLKVGNNSIDFNSGSTSTTASAGGVSFPSALAGYINITINGSTKKLPYFNA